MKNTNTINVGIGLLKFLQEPAVESGDKFSKLDAFIFLLESAATSPCNVSFHGTEVLLVKGQLATSYSQLAEEWNWHRNNVRLFLSDLEEMKVIAMEKRGKATVITLPVIDSATNRAVRILDSEELRLWRYIIGVSVFDELAEIVDTALTNTEEDLNHMADSDGSSKSIGSRLHGLINHMLMQSAKVFPASTKVEEALTKMFVFDCNADLQQFFILLALGGIKVMNDAYLELDGDAPLLPDEISQRLAVVTDYYKPLMSGTDSTSEASPTPLQDGANPEKKQELPLAD